MKNFTFNLNSLLTYSLSSILLFSCSTDKDDLVISEELSSASSAALTLATDDIIALHSTGGYLSADDTYLIFKGSSADDDGEKFKIVNHGNDVISLLSLKTNKYVSSEFTQNIPMTANRPSAAAWEKFNVHYLDGDVVAFSNSYNGSTKYMCSEGGRSDAAFSRDGIGGAWEKFTIEHIISQPSNNNSGSGIFNLDEFGIETSSSCSSSTSTTTNSDTELNDGEEYTMNGLDFYKRSGSTYILTSCDQDGRRTEWKQSSRFSLSDSKKMSYTGKFEDYPSDGVTIAQVHNRGGAGRPLLRAEIAHDKIEFVIVDTHVKGEGSSYTIEGPSYSEGSYLDLSLEVGNNKIIAIVTTTSGTKTVTYSKDNSSIDKRIDDEWFTDDVENNDIKLYEGFYFKAGVYNDSGNDSDMPVGSFTYFDYQG